MRTLSEHAMHELQAAKGLYDLYPEAAITQVMELIKLFEASNDIFSARLVTLLFIRLANREPLTPLTGNDDEWEQYTDDLWVNKRYPNVRKGPDGVAYDADAGKIITFPYTPVLHTDW